MSNIGETLDLAEKIGNEIYKNKIHNTMLYGLAVLIGVIAGLTVLYLVLLQ